MTLPQCDASISVSDENNLYTLPFVQDVESIDYSAWFPMTSLRYNDDSSPCEYRRRFSRRLFRGRRAIGYPRISCCVLHAGKYE